jgi:hypothetical protein
MAEEGAPADCEQSGQQPPVPGQLEVTHRVDAAIKAMQMPAVSHVSNLVTAKPEA